MAALEVTKKLHVYHTLYRLNLSFSNIVGYCQTLQEAGIFKPKDMRLYQGYTQELQSEIDELCLETIHKIEFNDWGRFGKIREAEEKRLRDPADVLIQAEELQALSIAEKENQILQTKAAQSSEQLSCKLTRPSGGTGSRFVLSIGNLKGNRLG